MEPVIMFPAAASFVVCIALALSRTGAQGEEENVVEKREVSMCQSICSDGVSFNGQCYHYYSVTKTWADAELHCLSLGGNLASVHSDDDNQFIQDLIKSNEKKVSLTWLGGSDCFKEGSWVWTDGSKWDYSHWNKNEPNNQGVENCLHTNWGGSGGWNDYSCTAQYPFVCVTKG
ncbi:lactose-binding lectin l-2-like [Polyodon spathula]|uniref:lactose-binding lectin l-2-like n=1 Tax=Polyodon spathula TaxID=7913 RepID=UPI001B7EAAFE|nr:lactose-binding lectin l-2-like [Polyodon spathula]XP_041103279.1 lactose-binding lectin l-2-like [Polyodon spathula]